MPMDWFKLIPKQKKKKIIIFGRAFDNYQPVAKCDACGKTVTMRDYAFLCESCRNQLPEYAKENHHWLLPFPEARQIYLMKAIEQKAKGVSKS